MGELVTRVDTDKRTLTAVSTDIAVEGGLNLDTQMSYNKRVRPGSSSRAAIFKDGRWINTFYIFIKISSSYIINFNNYLAIADELNINYLILLYVFLSALSGRKQILY